jgi:hypothetical protein
LGLIFGGDQTSVVINFIILLVETLEVEGKIHIYFGIKNIGQLIVGIKLDALIRQ